ncbi:hypothetical protein ABVF11_02400 [Pediococcus argentinicus]|uniref:hypothetical protein n=1 Tax=Pediococcus argentinicus TaxID=480391 RepID=UPI00338F2717
MSDVVVAVTTAIITAIGTVIVANITNSGSQSVSKVETLPDLAEQLSKLIEENRKLSVDNIELQRKLSSIQAELIELRKTNQNLNLKINELLKEKKS